MRLPSTGDRTSLWTQKPTSSCGRGQSARRPRFRGVQDFASSCVSNTPIPCTIAQKRDGLSLSNINAEMPRWPGGWFAGSSHISLPGWPSSVDSSDHVSAPSRLSKIPGASTPTSTRPSSTASVDTFESFRPDSASYASPSLESAHGCARPPSRATRSPRQRRSRRSWDRERRGRPATPRRTGRAAPTSVDSRRSRAGSSPSGCRPVAGYVAGVSAPRRKSLATYQTRPAPESHRPTIRPPRPSRARRCRSSSLSSSPPSPVATALDPGRRATSAGRSG